MQLDDYILANPAATAADVNDAVGWRDDAVTLQQIAEAVTAAMPGATAQDRAAAADLELTVILAAVAASPSPVVQAVAQQLQQGRAVAIGSAAVRGKLAALLPADQLAVLTPLMRSTPPVTDADVAAAKARLARRAEADALLVKLASYESHVRTRANAYVAGDADALPEVPTL